MSSLQLQKLRVFTKGSISFFSLLSEKLTNPSFNFEGSRESGFLKRAGSNSSLNSLFSTEGDPHIRSCDDCRKLLERRDQLMEQRNTKSTIVLLYEVLCSISILFMVIKDRCYHELGQVCIKYHCCQQKGKDLQKWNTLFFNPLICILDSK